MAPDRQSSGDGGISMSWNSLIGKKILCYRGYKIGTPCNKNLISLAYILFDDEKSFIRLTEQDEYAYHDCSPYARHIELNIDKEVWKKLFNKEGVEECTGEYVDFD